jgi:hypothetical protein
MPKKIHKLGDFVSSGKFWEHRETYYLCPWGKHWLIKIVEDYRKVGDTDWIPLPYVLEYPAWEEWPGTGGFSVATFS